jgi:hypothetical protein
MITWAGKYQMKSMAYNAVAGFGRSWVGALSHRSVVDHSSFQARNTPGVD